jgi:hypothetical protein
MTGSNIFVQGRASSIVQIGASSFAVSMKDLAEQSHAKKGS